MKTTRSSFTMSELLISFGLMTLLMAAVMPFLVNSLKTNLGASIQGTMLTQKATTLEWMKRDLQGTSRAQILVTPEDGRDIRAISFPVLRRDPADTTSPLTDTYEIAWTETVIYHIRQVEDDEFELRRTTFRPRDTELELTQRQEQLNDVLRDGDGRGTYNGGNSVTTTALEHVSEYELNIEVTEIDGYAPEVGHRVVPLGSFLLSPGDHHFKFLVTDKNPDSAGFKLGIDYVVASVTGSPMEAEYFIPPASFVGPMPNHGAMYMYSGWSNHAQLDFPAAAPEQSVTFQFHNDTWMESGFTDETAALHNAEVTFDPASKEIVIQQIGDDTSWSAAVQAGAVPAPGATSFQNATVRMILGGADPVVGGNIVFAGRKGAVTFQAGPGGSVTIDEAFIMVRTEGSSGDPGTLTPITFSGSTGDGVTVSNGGITVALTNGASVASDVVDLEIDPEKDYLISFHIMDDAAQSQPQTWPDPTGRTHAYLLPNDASGQAGVADWSGIDPASVEALSSLVGVESLATTYPEESSYTSQIFDTRLENAQFREVDWRADTPAGTVPPTIKIRAGSSPDLSGASSWEGAPSFLPGDSLASLAGRYVQFRAEFHCTEPYEDTARLRDVIITWDGEARGVDLSAAITAGPDRGKFRVMVDDVAFPAIGVRARFAVKRKLLSREFAMSFAVETNPRNP